MMQRCRHTRKRCVKELETNIENGDVRLAATLCLPESAGRFPFVVFLHGSGPLDRNENMASQRLEVFNALAHHLAANGVASLRYDKRGCGASTGNFREAGLTEFASDAEACVDAVSRSELCAEVFLVAHSEGCVLAPVLARKLPRLVSAIALLCPFMPPVEQILLAQAEQIQRDLDALPLVSRFFFRLAAFGLRDPVQGQRALIARIRASTSPTLRVGLRPFPAKWLRELLAVEAQETFGGVTCPVLFVAGEKDLQCNPAHVDQLRELVAGPVTAHVVTDLTHVLRLDPGPPSLLGTHKLLKSPVAANVLELTSQWLTSHAARIDSVSLPISAAPRTVYAAFENPTALTRWLPPEGMLGRVIEYDFRAGGNYRIELTYPEDCEVGKTTGRTDVSIGRFLALKSNERIVQSVRFESEDPAFAGEMTLTWFFEGFAGSTRVTIAAEKVPPGITRPDHLAGLRSSLENLARFVSSSN
jgi:pimeloyl-ACP methyl ester carboxylesterase/uncharacterized protein YndB with AHSA1/START domain